MRYKIFFISLFKIVLTLLLLAIPISIVGQTLSNPEKKLRGKHAVELTFGLLSEMSNTNELSSGDVTTKSSANGFIGSLDYSYWFENNLAFHLSVGVTDADAATSVNGANTLVESAAVIPLLFGLKYQPFRMSASNAVRPYLSASVGPYFGFASNVRTGAITGTETISETALGSRLAVGFDVSLGKLFVIGLAAGYRLVTDFDNRIGAETNYSSPEFSLSFGIVFGR